MNPVPPARPLDAAKPIDDFEWPPTADDLSVYEIGPDPWQNLQDASSQVFAARHRERPQPPRQPAPGTRQKLAGVLAASAIVAAAAGWAFYAAMTPPVAVHAVHHPAPVTAAPAPPPITIVATYPVAAAPATPAPAAAPAPGVPAPGVPAPGVPAPGVPAPGVPVDAVPGGIDQIAANPAPAGPVAPIEAPAESEPAAAPSDAPAPAAVTPAADPGADTPDAGIRSLLQRYEDAYDRRDVRTAAALWPSLDRPALTRAFAGLDRQDVHFNRCDIDASGAHGSAVCVGTVRYVPSVGRAVEKEDHITWTFDLARSGEDWRIAGLSAH